MDGAISRLQICERVTGARTTCHSGAPALWLARPRHILDPHEIHAQANEPFLVVHVKQFIISKLKTSHQQTQECDSSCHRLELQVILDTKKVRLENVAQIMPTSSYLW